MTRACMFLVVLEDSNPNQFFLLHIYFPWKRPPPPFSPFATASSWDKVRSSPGFGGAEATLATTSWCASWAEPRNHTGSATSGGQMRPSDAIQYRIYHQHQNYHPII